LPLPLGENGHKTSSHPFGGSQRIWNDRQPSYWFVREAIQRDQCRSLVDELSQWYAIASVDTKSGH
jgi:hypothetical protein